MTILAFIAIFAALDPLSGVQQAGQAVWLATFSMLAGFLWVPLHGGCA